MQSDNTTVANNFNFPLETNYSRPGKDFVTTNSLADRDFAVFGLDYTPLKLDIRNASFGIAIAFVMLRCGIS